MSRTIEFHFDFASPYGYFAAREIEALAARRGARTVWRPMLLGAVFKVTGSAPNLSVPLRGEYLRRDVARIARSLDVPLTIPDSSPVRAVPASRAFYWLDAEDPERAKALARALLDAHWLDGVDIGEPARVRAVAMAMGLDGEALSAGVETPEVKARLRDETDRAIARGVFGAPFFFVGDEGKRGEPFWGWDRMPMLEEWLRTGGW